MIGKIRIDRKFWINFTFFALGGALLLFLYIKYRVPANIDGSFEFKTLDGEMHHLSEYKGKTVFLNCWATWCGPCVSEMPSIEQAKQQLDSTKIIFITVAEEDLDMLKSFQDRHGYSMMFTQTVKPFKEIGVNSYPTTYIIDRKGHIALSEIGGVNWSDAATLAQIRQIME